MNTLVDQEEKAVEELLEVVHTESKDPKAG